MSGQYRDTVIIQEHETIEEDLGDVKKWVNKLAIKGKKVELSTEGRALYEQISHPDVECVYQFPGTIKFKIDKHRLKINGQLYELIEPPKHIGGIKKITRVALREVEEADGN
ncbi:MAG: hypothetical protein ACOCVB_00750 [Bacillota bacterium]